MLKTFPGKLGEKYLGFGIAFLFTIYAHSSILFSKAMPGDSFDARATMVWYEHWYSFLRGQVPLRDLRAFFPADNILGGSDSNLAQGVIFSIFRILGIQLSLSFKLTVVVITFIGFLGVSRLSFLVFRDLTLSISAILISLTSYQLIAQSSHVQTWLYMSVAWIMIGLIKLYRGEDIFFAATLIFLGIPILALSTWYCIIALFFLGGLYLIFFGSI